MEEPENYDLEENYEEREGMVEDANSEEQSDEEDNDSDGWINPSNIKSMKKNFGIDEDVHADVTVACITTDFAMQVGKHSLRLSF